MRGGRSALAWFEALAGGVVLAGLLWAVRPSQVLAALAGAAPTALVVGLALLGVAVFAQAARLRALGGTFGLGFAESLRITLASYVFQHLLPGSLGGEGYRALRLRRLVDRWGPALGVVTLDRAIGAAVLLVPGAAVAAMEHRRLGALLVARRPGLAATALPWLAGAAALAVAVALLWRFGGRSRRVRGATRAAFDVLRESVRRAGRRRCVVTLALAVVYHGLRLAGVASLLAAFGDTLGVADLLVVLALTLVVSSVPSTLGALGVREGALVFALGAFGADPGTALAVALLNRSVLLGFAAAGALVLLASPQRADPSGERGSAGLADPSARRGSP